MPSEVTHSFDIFDTVLMRRVGHPSKVFWWLSYFSAEALQLPEPKAFEHLRIEAEQRARLSHQPTYEVTLIDIYQQLAFTLNKSADWARQVAAAEQALEALLLSPVPGAATRLAEARQASGPGDRGLLFVSDMYLPASFLQEQLAAHRLCQPEDAVLVSCEAGLSKHSGQWFPQLRKDHRALGTHTGNDPLADKHQAEQSGLQAVLLQDHNLNAAEKIWASAGPQALGLGDLLAAAGRFSRLEALQSNPAYPTALVQSTCCVAAPYLTSFVLWVLARAKAKGLKRLYFLSRDGQIFYEIARQLVGPLRLSIEVHYLYGGRKAWYMARTVEVDAFLLDFLLESPHRLTLEMVAARAATRPEALRQATGLDCEPQQALDRAQKQQLRKALEQGPGQQLLLQTAAQQRELALAYLSQAGLGDPLERAVVDVGWTGKTLRTLNELLELGGWPPVEGYFIGQMSSTHAAVQPGVHPWLFEEGSQRGFFSDSVPPLTWALMTENLTAGDHGSVLGYARSASGEITPQFASPENAACVAWGQPAYRDCLKRFVNQLISGLQAPAKANPEGRGVDWAQAHLQSTAFSAMERFYTQPTAAEAHAWLSFPTETDPTGAIKNAWGRPYNWGHVWHILRYGYLHEDWTLWQQGSRAASSPSVLKALKLSLRFRKATQRLLRR
jgi:hypothetical protein